MLRLKFFLTVCIVTVILALVAEHEVSAAPVPCFGFRPMRRKPAPMKKPEPPKAPKKDESKKKKLEELGKLLQQLYPDWNIVVTTPQPATTAIPDLMDNYMDFLGKLFNSFL